LESSSLGFEVGSSAVFSVRLESLAALAEPEELPKIDPLSGSSDEGWKEVGVCDLNG
jgi:hypothetical protein